MVPVSMVRPNRGFTIVEALIVLAILALMTLIAVPWFLKITQRNALKSSAREIQITLTAARMAAVKRNAPVSVAIVSLTPPIQFQTIEPQPPAPTPTMPAKMIILPQNAVRFNATPNTSNGTITFGGDGRLISTPPLPILTPSLVMIVEGPVNSSPRNQIRIETNSRGAVKVVTPVDWQ